MSTREASEQKNLGDSAGKEPVVPKAGAYVIKVEKVLNLPSKPTQVQRAALLQKQLAARAERTRQVQLRIAAREKAEAEAAAQMRRQQKKTEAASGTKKVDEAVTQADDFKKDPFGGELEAVSTTVKQAAKGKSGLASVSEDPTLTAVVDGLDEVKTLIEDKKFYDAFRKLKELTESCQTGRDSQEEKRKKAVVGENKKIHQDRVANYDKLKLMIEAATAQALAATNALEATNNELCAAVVKMNNEFSKGNKDALNPWHVKNLKDFLKIGGLDERAIATSKKHLDKACELLDAEYQNRLNGATSPEAKANLLLDFGQPAGEGTSGTSEVQIIKDAHGKIAYAFKPLTGETTQNKGDTLREVVSSSMCKAFTELTKFDLGFPEVSVVNVGGRGGALIEGINGTELPAEKKDKFTAEEKAQLDQMANDVPAEELQKVMLSAMVCGDGDMKWDNVFLVDDGKKARRFDGGKGFPDEEGRAEIFLGEGPMFSLKILGAEDSPLLNTPFSKTPLAAGDAPMDWGKIVVPFLEIEAHLDDLKDRMVKETQAACKTLSTDDKPQTLDAKAIEQTVRSIKSAVEILKANDPITTKQFYKAWASQRVLDMASDFLADQKAAIGEFNKYDQKELAQALAEMKIKGDMNASVSAIQDVVLTDPTQYEDADAKTLHDHFQIIDRLLAAFEFVKLDPDPNYLQEIRKLSKINVPKLKKDENKKDIPIDADGINNLVWDTVKKLSKEEKCKLLAKLSGIAGAQNQKCARPGGGITIGIRHADEGTQPRVGMGTTIAVYIVDSKVPADLAGLVKAALG